MRGDHVRRILVLVTGPLNERLAGPEIRALEFAKALCAEYEVTLVAQRDHPGERNGLRVIPASRRRILVEAARHDAVLSPSLPPYLFALAQLLGVVTIADLYDPYELELVALGDERHDRELGTRAISQALQLRYADLVLCAGASQRAQLVRSARSSLGGSRAVALDPIIMPFGIQEAPPPSKHRPIRARHPEIAEGDKIVMWWGTVWKWLDAETAIRAFALIGSARSDVKLVITAGKPPNRNNHRFDGTGEAVDLARELGVLGRTVFFLDEWIPYEERHDYLHEASVGLTLHRFEQEAHTAARARFMDYLAAELPCVLGRGDETAADFEAAGFATLLDGPEPELLASRLLALIDDPDRLAASRAAGRRLAAERSWTEVGARLREAVGSIPARRPGEACGAFGLLAGTSTYYRRRAAELLTATLG